ncbi:MAG: peptidoglycan-binding protein [Nocardiopsaceae bacterium]|nr:peptidoglycan-binding protein [Nocardiopsaceae bacterium]
MSRRLAVPAALVAAGITGVVGAIAVTGGSAAPAATPRIRLSTATVKLTNLTATMLTAGVMGYAPARPLTNQIAGTYTHLPSAGSTIAPGHVLYRVDNQPVIAMKGRTPAWRPMVPGITGPDVRELQANLIALGYADGLLTAPTGFYDSLTAAAVQRWQHAIGVLVTGQVGLGQVVFIPSAVRVGALIAAPGRAAFPGQEPYQVTTTKRIVIVPVNPTQPTVRIGERVSIVLPSQTRTRGRVTAIGPPPAGLSAASAGSGRHGSAASATVLILTPSRPAATGTGRDVAVQVSLTVQSVRHVLAVPVSALLALSGGGYGIEVVSASGRHHLVGVTAGTFAGGLVQVSGPGVSAGTKVVVAQ